MTTNNGLNQASEIFVVGPIGTAADGGTLLTVRKDQAATTAIGILNETNNASSQCFLNIKQQLNNGGSPYLSTCGIGVVNDQAGSNVYAGYCVVQNETGGANTGTLGLVLWDAHSTGTVKVGIGVPASAVDQAIWTTTGGQYRGKNSNTSPPAGFIGEQLTTGYVSGISLSTATPFNLGSLSVTAGIWMFYAFITYTTTSSVSGNTDWFCSFNTTSATLPGAGLQQVDIGGIAPRNGGNNITVSHCFYVKVASTTTWYCVGQGSGSSVFNSVTGNGAFWAVRVG